MKGRRPPAVGDDATALVHVDRRVPIGHAFSTSLVGFGMIKRTFPSRLVNVRFGASRQHETALEARSLPSVSNARSVQYSKGMQMVLRRHTEPERKTRNTRTRP